MLVIAAILGYLYAASQHQRCVLDICRNTHLLAFTIAIDYVNDFSDWLGLVYYPNNLVYIYVDSAILFLWIALLLLITQIQINLLMYS